MNRTIAIAALAFFTIFMIAGCIQQQSPLASAGNTEKNVSFTLKYPGSGVSVIQESLTASEGTNLIDAMQANGTQVKYKEYSFGKMVIGIGIIEPGQGQYLAIYVNGK